MRQFEAEVKSAAFKFVLSNNAPLQVHFLKCNPFGSSTREVDVLCIAFFKHHVSEVQSMK